MKYYRVKKEFDNYPMFKNTATIQAYDGIYIGNELFTEKELEKHMKNHKLPARVTTMFDVVEISKKRTYWFFGARFYR